MRRDSIRPGRLLLCTAAVGAAALAGCSTSVQGDPGPAVHNQGSTQHGNTATSGPNTGAAPITDLSKLADKVTQAVQRAKSAHVAAAMTLQGKSYMQIDGDMSVTGKQMAFKGSVVMHPKIMILAFASGQSTDPQTQQQLEKTPDTADMQLVVKDGFGYVKSPLVAANAKKNGCDPAKPWCKSALSSGGSAATSSTNTLNPANVFQQAKQKAHIVRTKSEQLNGEHVIHYWMAANDAKTGNPPVQFWVDDKYRPVKLWTHVDINKTTGQMQIEYGKWGAPVTIDVPPADQVSTSHK